MTGPSGALPASPFARLRGLLDGITPPGEPVSLALGEPRFEPPAFVLRALAEDTEDYRRYPPIEGIPAWRHAVGDWLQRRFALERDVLGEPAQILPVNGTREALFLAPQIAPPKPDGLVAMPNPFYQVYASAALAIGATPLYLPATRDTGFLPDLSQLDAATLARLQVMYLCSPANPQGAVASPAYLASALALARQHNFLLLVDECYSEIYDQHAPPSMLQIMAQQGADDAPVMVFHSLSKRSNLPGLRSGFCAGGRSAMHDFLKLRQVAGPQSPLPVQRAAALAWSDDAHVRTNRQTYQANFDAADRHLAGRFGYQRPAAGFFLWLDVGDGEAAAKYLWQQAGLRVLPGAYLTVPHADGTNHGAPYIRVALVEPPARTEAALAQLADGLADFEAKTGASARGPA